MSGSQQSLDTAKPREPLTPRTTPNQGVFPSPVPAATATIRPSLVSPAIPQSPRFAEAYSVFNSTPGNLVGTDGPFPAKSHSFDQSPLPALPSSLSLTPSQTWSLLPAQQPSRNSSLAHQADPSKATCKTHHSRTSLHKRSLSRTLHRPQWSGSFIAAADDFDFFNSVSSPKSSSASKKRRVSHRSSSRHQTSQTSQPPKPKAAGDSEKSNLDTYCFSPELTLQDLTPPPTARKEKRKACAARVTMHDDQASQQGYMNPADAPLDMSFMMNTSADFGMPQSAPVGTHDVFWDTNFSFNVGDGFSFDTFANQQSTFDTPNWLLDQNPQMQQAQTQPLNQSNVIEQSDIQNVPRTRKERTLAPKPIQPLEADASMAPQNWGFDASSAPLSATHGTAGIDPGHLFSSTQQNTPLQASMHRRNSSSMDGQLPEEMIATRRASGGSKRGEPKRANSLQTRKGKLPNRHFASSPVKPSMRPGLSRSYSENRVAGTRRASSAQSSRQRGLPQSHSSSVIEPTRIVGRSGRTSPLKHQHRLSELASIPEISPRPHVQTGRPRLTVNRGGLAQVELVIPTAGMSKPDDSGSESCSSESDDEPIIITSRNSRSFALQDSRRPKGGIYHNSRHTFGDARLSGGDDQDDHSDAETIRDGRASRHAGDASSELLTVASKRMSADSTRPKRHQYRSGPADSLISPSYTDATFGSDTPSVRCVCNRNGTTPEDGFMVQCESCEKWLHGDCINRRTQPRPYICAFCANEAGQFGTSSRVLGRGFAHQTSPLANKSVRVFR